MNTLTTSHADTPPAVPPLSSSSSGSPSFCHTAMSPKDGITMVGYHQDADDHVALLNNNGVYLLHQNRRTEAANVFLRALWHVEAKTGGGSISQDLQGNQHATPVGTVPNGGALNTPQAGERAKPSSYIYQREDYDEGLYVYRDAIPMTLATPQEQLVILRYNMGQVYLRYKQYNQARRWFQTALIQVQHLASSASSASSSSSSYHHHLCLSILHNLGFCYYCLGENEHALKCYQDALNYAPPLLHDGASQEQADTYNCIAVLLFHTSNAKEDETAKAMELLKQAMAIYQRLCGPHSRQVATCLGNMGRIHFLTSAHECALKAFHKAYEIRKQLFGNDSMDTAAMLFNLGQSLHYRGALDQTLEAYREFLRVAREYYNHGNDNGNDNDNDNSSTGNPSSPSSSHRDICAVQRAMAQVYRQKGELRHACALLKQAYEAGCSALGPLETEVSCIMSELGSLYAEANDYPNAIDCFSHFLQTQQQVHQHNPLHNNILITKINLARVYKHSSDYLSAFRYYKEVHAMQVQLAARNAGSSLEVASTLSSMGLMLYLLQAYKPALDCYQEALRVRLDKLGTSQHADVAETINSIGLVLFKLGMMDMAKEAFQECIQLRTKLLQQQQQHNDNNRLGGGEENQPSTTSSPPSPAPLASSKEIAVLLFNMATACLQNGEEDQGMEWYNESLRVERQVLGESHPDVGMTLQHIARVHEDRGDFEQAIHHNQQALEIARKQCGENTNKKELAAVARLLKTIGNLQFMQGNVADGMACFSEATRVLQVVQTTTTTTIRVEGITATAANFYGFSKLHPPAAPVA